MKQMLKLGMVLALYAAAACVGLAFVYSGTKATIEEKQQADLDAALKELFPQGDSFEEITGAMTSSNAAVTLDQQYAARRGSELIGVAVRSSVASYGGAAVILSGIGADGKLSGVKILENKDTPGLGANAGSPSYYVDRTKQITFYGQFTGKAVSDPFEAKGDVSAITAATITSEAIASGVKASGQAAFDWIKKNQGGAK